MNLWLLIDQMRYRKWLWWTRFGMMVTATQFIVALYVMYIIVKDISYSRKVNACFLGKVNRSILQKFYCAYFFYTLWFYISWQPFVIGALQLMTIFYLETWCIDRWDLDIVTDPLLVILSLILVFLFFSFFALLVKRIDWVLMDRNRNVSSVSNLSSVLRYNALTFMEMIPLLMPLGNIKMIHCCGTCDKSEAGFWWIDEYEWRP